MNNTDKTPAPPSSSVTSLAFLSTPPLLGTPHSTNCLRSSCEPSTFGCNDSLTSHEDSCSLALVVKCCYLVSILGGPHHPLDTNKPSSVAIFPTLAQRREPLLDP